MSRLTDISQRHIYTDLLRKFRDEGHNVYIITPMERGNGSWFMVHGSWLMATKGSGLKINVLLDGREEELL